MNGCEVLLLLVCATVPSVVSAQETVHHMVVAVQGQIVTLPCIDHHHSSQVVWRKAQELTPLTVGLVTLSADSRYDVRHPSDARWDLVIRDVSLEDSGTYECQSGPGQSARTVRMTLTVISDEEVWNQRAARGFTEQEIIRGPKGLGTAEAEAAPEFLEGEDTLVGRRGMDMTITCHVTGNPLPDVRWITPNGHIVRSAVNAKRYSTTRVEADQVTLTSVLHVHDLQADDFGFYKCEAANNLGTRRRYVKVTKGGR